MLNQGVDRVDGDDGAGVASAAQNMTGPVDSAGDLVWGVVTLVHELVANGDGRDIVPGVSGGVDDGMKVAVDVVDVENASKDLQAVSLCCTQNHGDLIAVDAVNPDCRVFSESGKIMVDFVL